MPPRTCERVTSYTWVQLRGKQRQQLMQALGVILLLVLVAVELTTFNPVQANALNHTVASVDNACEHVTYSPDGNPFPICPGPYPQVGGNCTWWAWEQWHLLGYNLPLNWGNAADWIIDAERAGLALGTVPRLAAIAVFPRADGVWAYGPPGHVAFVTAVYNNGHAFDVTYQNYGDSTPMYVGKGYDVSVINDARFQHGNLRFIYFPQVIDAARFSQLPGINGASSVAVAQANQTFARASNTTSPLTDNRIALGPAPVSSEQEFNADFTGTGVSDLLLYNRQQGRLDILELANTQPHLVGRHVPNAAYRGPVPLQAPTTGPRLVALGDTKTLAGHWGSSLDVHVGNFDGSGASDILLYDRVTGVIQLISLTPALTIKKHVILPGWGPDWELYVGQFTDHSTGVFMYKRFAFPDPTLTSTSSSSSTPTVGPTSIPRQQPTTTPRTKPTPKPTPKATPKPDPTVTKSPTATPDSTVTATPEPTATPKPSVTPDPTATKSPTPTATVDPTATRGTQTATGTPRPLPTVIRTPMSTKQGQPDIVEPSPTTSAAAGTSDLSGNVLQNWEVQGRTSNIYVLDFNTDFSIRHQQQYTLWHANWEVYVGRFVSKTHDGIFLYDRSVGEGRLLDFDRTMRVADYQALHALDGNWVISSGDFTGTGRAQLLLYDPSAGNAQMLSFAPDLALQQQKTYTGWGTNRVLYVGHFGMNTLGTMLYDPQSQHSTFMAFDTSLAVLHQRTVQSWSQRWQILVGSFLDRSLCQRAKTCRQSDDILVLDRQTGQIEQYVFSFGRQFQVFDNRAQSFLRNGIASSTHLDSIDSTTFSLTSTLDTKIRNEELY